MKTPAVKRVLMETDRPNRLSLRAKRRSSYMRVGLSLFEFHFTLLIQNSGVLK